MGIEVPGPLLRIACAVILVTAQLFCTTVEAILFYCVLYSEILYAV